MINLKTFFETHLPITDGIFVNHNLEYTIKPVKEGLFNSPQEISIKIVAYRKNDDFSKVTIGEILLWKVSPEFMLTVNNCDIHREYDAVCNNGEISTLASTQNILSRSSAYTTVYRDIISQNTNIYLLSNLYVKEAYRCKGFGSAFLALLPEIVEHCCDEKLTVLTLTSSPLDIPYGLSKAEARKKLNLFYEKNGFTLHGDDTAIKIH